MNKVLNIINTIIWVFLMVAVVGFFGSMEIHQFRVKTLVKQYIEQREQNIESYQKINVNEKEKIERM